MPHHLLFAGPNAATLFPDMLHVSSSGPDIDWADLAAEKWRRLQAGAAFVPLQQSAAFGEMIKAGPGALWRAQITHAGATIGVVQVKVRKLPFGARLATAMLGPVWLGEVPEGVKADAYRALKTSFPLKGLRALMMMPRDPADTAALAQAGYMQVVSDYHTGLLDLTADEDQLRAGLHGKWRNRLTRAEKDDLRISPVGRAPLAYRWLLDAEQKQQRSSRYTALPPRLVPLFQDKGGKTAVTAFEAKRGNDRLGGVLFLVEGSTATYHIGWTNEAGREAGANNLLLWHAIRALKKRDIQTLDLGGIDTDKTPGIARFKLGLGPRLLSQGGTWLAKPKLLGR